MTTADQTNLNQAHNRLRQIADKVNEIGDKLNKSDEDFFLTPHGEAFSATDEHLRSALRTLYRLTSESKNYEANKGN